MLDIEGLALTDDDRALLVDPAVGGLILFSRNYQDPVQLRALISDIRDLRPNILIAVDHEGGRVQRFREHFSSIPPMRLLGQFYMEDKQAAITLVEQVAWLLAIELIAFDIDFSFAPVLDLDYGNSEVIGDRAFARDSEVVEVLSTAFIKGMRSAGMASTGKHFPGHGYVAADSHTDVPVDDRPLDAILAEDARVFKYLIAQGLDAVMPAHVIYPAVDSQPAGFSPFWIKRQLREHFGFDGVVFSDDLGMEGATVAGSYAQRCDAALQADCDMVLVCNDREGAKQVLGHLAKQKLTGNGRLSTMAADRAIFNAMSEQALAVEKRKINDAIASLRQRFS